MDVTPIRTKRDHARALKEIEGLMQAAPGTPTGDRLENVMLLPIFQRRVDPLKEIDFEIGGTG
ncbi:MAG: hypothetical protein Tsb0016_04980 [Sphingomonadales bacterium]